MNKETASKLLAIMNEHDPGHGLTTSAEHRVPLYVAAVDLLTWLRAHAVDLVEASEKCVYEWEEAQGVCEYAFRLAHLLHEELAA